MKELDTFTVERLEEFIRQPLENGLTRNEQMDLARIALSAKQAEPVAYGTLQKEFCDEERSLFTDKDSASKYSESCYDLTPLYTTPQLNSPEIPEGWIKCSDQDPLKSGPYWCWFGNEKPSVIRQRVCMFNDRGNEWSDSSVTHWMPLPTAPEKENG